MHGLTFGRPGERMKFGAKGEFPEYVGGWDTDVSHLRLQLPFYLAQLPFSPMGIVSAADRAFQLASLQLVNLDFPTIAEGVLFYPMGSSPTIRRCWGFTNWLKILFWQMGNKIYIRN